MSNAQSYNQESTALVIRRATLGDEAALERLSQLDGKPVPAEPVLLAETSGEVQAALSLADGAVVADPFRPTARLIATLRAHAAPATTPGENARGRLRLGRYPAVRALWPV